MQEYICNKANSSDECSACIHSLPHERVDALHESCTAWIECGGKKVRCVKVKEGEKIMQKYICNKAGVHEKCSVCEHSVPHKKIDDLYELCTDWIECDGVKVRCVKVKEGKNGN